MPRPKLIDNRWIIGSKLGSGGFGDVYRAKDLEEKNVIAVKMEKEDSSKSHLEVEYDVYQKLQKSRRAIFGFPKALFFGTEGEYNVLVMEHLGPSLEDIRRARRSKSLSLKSVLMIGLQAVTRLEILHHKDFVHQDVKPDNLLTGKKDFHRIYLVDFGLAKEYRDPLSLQHIRSRSGRGFMGTRCFSSVRADRGYELSRRDDLESLGYALIYLYHGTLPWMRLHAGCKSELNLEVTELKARISSRELCRDMPSGVRRYIRYVRGLGFDETPKYTLLRSFFYAALQRRGLEDDRVFDWMRPKH